MDIEILHIVESHSDLLISNYPLINITLGWPHKNVHQLLISVHVRTWKALV